MSINVTLHKYIDSELHSNRIVFKMETSACKTLRSTKKAGITRHLNKISQFVAENNEEELTSTISRLKIVFREFEKVHEEYCSLTEEDELNQQYYEQILGTYIEGMEKANTYLSSNATDTLSRVSHISDDLGRLSLPKIEIRPFSGEPKEYLSFMAVFDEMVDANQLLSNTEKLTLLLHYTEHEAYNSIKTCPLLGNDGYSDARATLKKRFGSRHLISEKVLSELRSSPHAISPACIRMLSDDANNAAKVLKKLGQYKDIDSQSIILDVVNKLPKNHQREWSKKAIKARQKSGAYPDFEQLCYFLEQVSDAENDPVYGSKSHVKTLSTSVIKPSDVHFDAQPQIATHRIGRRTSRPPCAKCGANHSLFVCNSFKALTNIGRCEFVLQNNMCANCLIVGHDAEHCFKNSVCSFPGCGHRHARLLHVEEEAFQVNNNFVTYNSTIYMPIVPVVIDNRVKTGALLDSASSGSFITQSAVKLLGITSKPIDHTLSTLNNTSNVLLEIVTVTLSSIDKHTKIDCDLYVIDSIPVSNPTIDVACYDHLCDIPIDVS